ncbi:MAG: methylenetetrahydrofolate reductase [Pseudomonadota bacterium]
MPVPSHRHSSTRSSRGKGSESGPNEGPRGTVSFEFFPPKGFSAERGLLTCAHAMRRLEPAFQTVTFGAGGSAIEDGLTWPHQLQGLTETPTAAHVTLVRFADRAAFAEHLSALWEKGIARLVLLRGDPVEGETPKNAGFTSVAEAVAFAKALHGFDISVAAYPETHPKAQSARSDMDALLSKQAAGADRAITQFFFHNADFYAFRDRAVAADVTIPIVPGIIPVYGFERIVKFAAACGAAIPDDMANRFAACGDDRHAQTELARGLIEAQVTDLARNGVEAIHIYTLNRSDIAADAVRAFRAALEGQQQPKLPNVRSFALAG